MTCRRISSAPNLGNGITLSAGSTGTQIIGNVIGASKTGAALGNQAPAFPLSAPTM